MNRLAADPMGVAARVRLSAATGAARLLAAGLRVSGRGGGTAAPGLVALRIDPDFVGKLTTRLAGGVVVVAGTNGKTTTARLLSAMLEASGKSVVNNRSGSNLMRGVASAFAGRTSIAGTIGADIAVIEADEAAFPEIVRRSAPRLILLNNLFRDQLDRYGELNAISNRWAPVLESLPASTTIVVNGDDPTLASITERIAAKRVVFGIEPGEHALDRLPHAADAAVCRTCGAELRYETLSVSHLGDWRCPGCGGYRPPLDVTGREIELDGVDGLQLLASFPGGADFPLQVRIPGLYNAYNVVAATTAASTLGVDMAVVQEALRTFTAPFGRIERIVIDGRTVTFGLVKNPTGFNEVLRMLVAGDEGLSLPTLIAINDLDADGRDVSWLWDVDFELLAKGSAPLSTTGIRGADMANRLKYAGIGSARLSSLPADLKGSLNSFVQGLPVGGRGFVLATYTAMLEMRRILAADGLAPSFWDQ